MNENKQGDKGLFEQLEERSPDYQAQGNNRSLVQDYAAFFNEDEKHYEFIVQDMFLDHFFP